MSPLSIWAGAHPGASANAFFSLLSLLNIAAVRAPSPSSAVVWLAEWGDRQPELPEPRSRDEGEPKLKIALARTWSRDIPTGWKFVKAPVASADVLQLLQQAGIHQPPAAPASSDRVAVPLPAANESPAPRPRPALTLVADAAGNLPLSRMEFRLKRWPNLSRKANGELTNVLVRTSAFLIQDWRDWPALEAFMNTELNEESALVKFLERCRAEGSLDARPPRPRAHSPANAGQPGGGLANKLLRSIFARQRP